VADAAVLQTPRPDVPEDRVPDVPPVHVGEDDLTRRGSRGVSAETALVKVVAGDLAATPARTNEIVDE
jgi:hypothetical protein